MLTSSLAPYLLWAKSRAAAEFDLAGSNLMHCTMDELPGAREALALSAPNDNGYPPLVDAIAAHYGVATRRVVTAAGCSGANFIAIAALTGAGDHVLVERPGYDPLTGACQLMGAAVERFERRFENGYDIDCDDLFKRITRRTRLIVLSTPHNPTGALIRPATLARIGQLADDAGAYVLVDEVYLDAACLVRGDTPTAASAARFDGPFIVTSSLTKSYGLAGLRSGWSIAPPATAERLRRARDLVDNASSAPADRLAALAFTQIQQLGERARRLLDANLGRARRCLAEHPRFELATPPAASVIFPRLGGCDDAGPFIQHLLTRQGVAVAPGSFFEAPAHFRLSLAGPTDRLDAGLARVSSALQDWSG